MNGVSSRASRISSAACFRSGLTSAPVVSSSSKSSPKSWLSKSWGMYQTFPKRPFGLQCFPNKTVVMIAHRLSTIRNADQILVMEKGCLIESGTHDELLKKDGKYAQMWSSYTESINWKIGTGKAV